MFLTVINPGTRDLPARPARRGLLGCLISLVIVVLLLAGGWFIIARPIVHGMVADELDKSMTAGTNQIPVTAPLLPPGAVIPVTESALNNLIVLNLAPSNPVQQPVTKITPSNIRIEFQVFGQQCAISGVPKAVNGQLVASDVTVEGIVGLVMSPDELTAQLNQHLSEAQQRLKHPITSVQLSNQKMELKLG